MRWRFFWLAALVLVLSWCGTTVYIAIDRPMPVELDDAYAYICKSQILLSDPSFQKPAVRDLLEQLENGKHHYVTYIRYMSMALTNYHLGYSAVLIALRKAGLSWESAYILLFALGSALYVVTLICVSHQFFGPRAGAFCLLIASFSCHALGVSQGFLPAVPAHIAFAFALLGCCVIDRYPDLTWRSGLLMLGLFALAVTFHPLGRIGCAAGLLFFVLRQGWSGVRSHLYWGIALFVVLAFFFVVPKFVDSHHLRIVHMEKGFRLSQLPSVIKLHLGIYLDMLYYWAGWGVQLPDVLRRFQLLLLLPAFGILLAGFLCLIRTRRSLLFLSLAVFLPLLADNVLYDPQAPGGLFARLFQWFGLFLFAFWAEGLYATLHTAKVLFHKRMQVSAEILAEPPGTTLFSWGIPVLLSGFVMLYTFMFVYSQGIYHQQAVYSAYHRHYYTIVPEQRAYLLSHAKADDRILIRDQVTLGYFLSDPAALDRHIRFEPLAVHARDPQRWMDAASNSIRYVYGRYEMPNAWQDGIRLEPGMEWTLHREKGTFQGYAVRLHSWKGRGVVQVDDGVSSSTKTIHTAPIWIPLECSGDRLTIRVAPGSAPVILGGVRKTDAEPDLRWAWDDGIWLRCYSVRHKQYERYDVSTQRIADKIQADSVKVLDDTGMTLLLEVDPASRMKGEKEESVPEDSAQPADS